MSKLPSSNIFAKDCMTRVSISTPATLRTFARRTYVWVECMCERVLWRYVDIHIIWTIFIVTYHYMRAFGSVYGQLMRYSYRVEIVGRRRGSWIGCLNKQMKYATFCRRTYSTVSRSVDDAESPCARQGHDRFDPHSHLNFDRLSMKDGSFIYWLANVEPLAFPLHGHSRTDLRLSKRGITASPDSWLDLHGGRWW